MPVFSVSSGTAPCCVTESQGPRKGPNRASYATAHHYCKPLEQYQSQRDKLAAEVFRAKSIIHVVCSRIPTMLRLQSGALPDNPRCIGRHNGKGIATHSAQSQQRDVAGRLDMVGAKVEFLNDQRSGSASSDCPRCWEAERCSVLSTHNDQHIQSIVTSLPTGLLWLEAPRGLSL
jgi:hypothetical protein